MINETKLPVEFILFKEPAIKEVIGYVSSTLIFAKKIVGRDIKCVSLMRTAGVPLPDAYVNMLDRADVVYTRK